jgi:hypothetical protein
MNTDENGERASGWRRWFRRPRGISATERSLIAAHGKTLAMLATTLQSGGHLDARRFAEMLALFGTVVSEEDKLQGAILALWAGAMEESLDLAGAAAV